ncbi:SNF2-related protein, partial [Streptomyces sp. NPDC057271]|uniref:DEAD/DEAH box helicase n=1 Tax=Streptomyces sp. NPDC057271 TaxID=3346078 RepID=UPI00363EFF7F
QTIAAHLIRQATPATAGPMLVVAPLSVLNHWKEEIALTAPGTPVRVLHGPRADLRGLEPHAIVLMTYEALPSRHKALLAQRWSMVVADEAQNIKTANAVWAQRLRSLNSHARFALTGTPVSNTLEDLWALLDWTTPGLLGDLNSFRTAYPSAPGTRGGKARAVQPAVALEDLIRPFVLRRTKSERGIAEQLPTKTYTNWVVPMAKDQAALYAALVATARNSGRRDKKASAMALGTKLRKIANHPAHYRGEVPQGEVPQGDLAKQSGKLAKLDELVTKIIQAGEAVLVFTQFVEMGRLIQRHLDDRGVSSFFLHGQVNKNTRAAWVKTFQSGADDAPSVFIISTKAGGTGLTLTRANHVIQYDLWWNPAVLDQADARAHRIGQTKPVQIHRLISQGTIEDKISEILVGKATLAGQVLDNIQGNADTLTDDDRFTELLAEHLAEHPAEHSATGTGSGSTDPHPGTPHTLPTPSTSAGTPPVATPQTPAPPTSTPSGPTAPPTPETPRTPTAPERAPRSRRRRKKTTTAIDSIINPTPGRRTTRGSRPTHDSTTGNASVSPVPGHPQTHHADAGTGTGTGTSTSTSTEDPANLPATPGQDTTTMPTQESAATPDNQHPPVARQGIGEDDYADQQIAGGHPAPTPVMDPTPAPITVMDPAPAPAPALDPVAAFEAMLDAPTAHDVPVVTVADVLTRLVHHVLSLAADGIVLSPQEVTALIHGPHHMPTPHEEDYTRGLLQATALPHTGRTGLLSPRLMGRFTEAVHTELAAGRQPDTTALLSTLLSPNTPTPPMLAQAQGWLDATALPHTPGLPQALIAAARHLASAHPSHFQAVNAITTTLMHSSQATAFQSQAIDQWLNVPATSLPATTPPAPASPVQAFRRML